MWASVPVPVRLSALSPQGHTSLHRALYGDGGAEEHDAGRTYSTRTVRRHKQRTSASIKALTAHNIASKVTCPCRLALSAAGGRRRQHAGANPAVARGQGRREAAWCLR